MQRKGTRKKFLLQTPTRCRRLLIFQIMHSIQSNRQSLKGCKDIGLRNFVARTQFYYSLNTLCKKVRTVFEKNKICGFGFNF